MGDGLRDELRAEFGQGARDILPILLGILPFGLLAGAVAIETGLTTLDAMGFSLVVFAGASQFAAIELLAQDTPLPAVIFTIAVINLRHLMYSASLAPQLAGTPRRWRIPSMFLLTDQAYAVSVIRSDTSPSHLHTLAYFLGAAIPMYANWQAATLVGALGGAAIPSSIPLEFAIPMVFLVLLVPALKDRPTIAAGATAGLGATLLGFLPSNLGLFIGALSGVAVGTLVARRQSTRQDAGVQA